MRTGIRSYPYSAATSSIRSTSRSMSKRRTARDTAKPHHPPGQSCPNRPQRTTMIPRPILLANVRSRRCGARELRRCPGRSAMLRRHRPGFAADDVDQQRCSAFHRANCKPWSTPRSKRWDASVCRPYRRAVPAIASARRMRTPETHRSWRRKCPTASPPMTPAIAIGVRRVGDQQRRSRVRVLPSRSTAARRAGRVARRSHPAIPRDRRRASAGPVRA